MGQITFLQSGNLKISHIDHVFKRGFFAFELLQYGAQSPQHHFFLFPVSGVLNNGNRRVFG